MTFEFDTARATDIDALVAIDANGQGWTRKSFEDELDRIEPTIHVLREESELVAFAVIRRSREDLDVVSVTVDPTRRRRGAARDLLRNILEKAREHGAQNAYLEVRESNEPARNLYRSLGFSESQKRKAFYENPVEDAVLMALSLQKKPG